VGMWGDHLASLESLNALRCEIWDLKR